ncbi:Receptor-type tyrosine-protein phosphatase [Dirofilaria immitis]
MNMQELINLLPSGRDFDNNKGKMDGRYQSNPRSDMEIVKPTNDSVYNNSAFDISAAESIQSDKNLHTDFYSTNKSSVCRKGKYSRSGYLNALGRERYKNKESLSHLYEESERNYVNRRGKKFQSDIQMKQNKKTHQKHGRRYTHRNYNKKKCGRFWRSFRRLFKAKEKGYRKYRHPSWEQALADEAYPAVQEATSASSVSSFLAPTEAKILQTLSSQLPPENSVCPGVTSQRKKENEEKIEEREKSIDKVMKSMSLEKMPQKKPETTSIANEELSLAKREKNDENDQQIRQKWKIIQFIEQIVKVGMEGIKDEFVHCRSFIPNAATRVAHDRNLKRCRYPDVICIDQTRIVLKNDDGGSDFIHASRVPLGDNPNEIIITQLPLPNTVKHFWEMVWQENVQIILLFLTINEWKEHAENIGLIPGKGKCLHIEEFMMLTYKNEFTIAPDWLVREYYLSKSDETRRILWYHYSAWEPNRSPRDCEYLWPLHSSLKKMRRPYICMSLAGVGRAGCYAALEWAHLMLHDKEVSVINIVECVRKAFSDTFFSLRKLERKIFPNGLYLKRRRSVLQLNTNIFDPELIQQMMILIYNDSQ